jgi:hypothetical protein
MSEKVWMGQFRIGQVWSVAKLVYVRKGMFAIMRTGVPRINA